MTKSDDRLIEVVFKGHRRDVFHNMQQLVIHSGDKVIVEAERGLDIGIVVSLESDGCCGRKNDAPVRNIRRIASSDDIERDARNRKREEDAFASCKEQIAHFKLDMKLVDVEQQFDASKLTFFFTADHRVDFRELVKKLASLFRTRIELRQIGVRDEAKRLGGIGACGRPQCCSEFMIDFSQVTTEQAREQQLSLNPSKISGNCGRLLCCLNHEIDDYLDAYKELPRSGYKFTNEQGKKGEVVFVDIFEKRVHVRFFEEGTMKFEWYDKAGIEKGKVDEVQPQRRR